jgi:hypothetical protein
MDLRFGQDKPQDHGEGYHAAAKALDQTAEIGNALALQSIQNSFEEQSEREQEFYTAARRAKRGLWDAGVAGDQQAVAHYSKKLEELKIAERQGAITGANSQIRQETLLKQTVNRFPHLEEQIRQAYSSTRARAQSEREQFKDPIEEGIDQAAREAAAAGMQLDEYMALKRSERAFAENKMYMEEDLAQGKRIQLEFAASIDRNYIPAIYSAMKNRITYAINQSQSSADFNAEQYKVVLTDNRPEAVLDREFVAAKKKEINDMFEEQINLLGNFDTLKALARAQALTTFESLEQVKKIDPYMAFIATIDPAAAVELAATGFNESKKAYDVSRSKFMTAIQNAPTAPQRAQLSAHLYILDSWYKDGGGVNDIGQLLAGNSLEGTGVPEVDGARLHAATTQTLSNPRLAPELKTAAAVAAIESEKQLAGPGEYIAPGPQWYKNPALAKQAKNDPETKRVLTENIDQATVFVAQKLSPEAAADLLFVTDLEAEMKHRDPTKAYQGGGPFQSAQARKRADEVQATRQAGLETRESDDDQRYLDTLNHTYWLYRLMHGATAAEQWAMQVVGGMQNPEGEEGDVETDENGTPVIDLDLTD